MLRQILLALCFVCSAWAAEVRLAWNPNTEPDLAGYRIHYGTASGSYSFHVDVGNVTTTAISGLSDGTRYYFVATAYNATLESDYSNEVNWISGEPPVYIGATNLRASKLQQGEPIMAWVATARKAVQTGTNTVYLQLNGTVAGNTIFVAVTQWYATAISVSDDVNGSYSEAFQSDYNSLKCGLFYKENIAGGNVTITVNASSSSVWAVAIEFSGGATSSPLDGTPTTNYAASGSTISTGNLTPANNDVLLLAVGAIDLTRTITENAGSEGFTLIEERENAWETSSFVYKIISGAPGTVSHSWEAGGSAQWICGIAAFKVASGGGSSAVPAMMRQYRARR